MTKSEKKNLSEKVKVEQLLYRVSAAMQMLDVCRATIYRMIDRGELERVDIGQRATRITAASIERTIAAGKKKG